MKRAAQGLFIASLVFSSLAVQAAESTGLTREQVRADLIKAEMNGTFPFSKVHYPDPEWNPSTVYVATKAAREMDKEAAAKRKADVDAASYGAAASGTSASGSRTDGGTSTAPQSDKPHPAQ
ncbi:hypothetical protein GCM10027093_27310 [Paraburkholderia jirisanensis]